MSTTSQSNSCKKLMSESYSRCGISITQSEKLSKCSETAFYLSFVYVYPILPRETVKYIIRNKTKFFETFCRISIF